MTKLTVTYSDINVLILDYLTTEGYPNAAAKFSTEANLQPHQDYASIQARQNIQNYIHSGNIQAAIECLNDLDPAVSSSPHTVFKISFQMITSRVYMHHAEGLRAYAEKQPPML